MPGKSVHVAFGAGAGATTAAIRARKQPLRNVLVETAGGAIGGYFGARVPDLIEPGMHNPRHRSVAHSIAAGTGLIEAAVTVIDGWESACRGRADKLHEARLKPDVGPIENAVLLLLELVVRAAAGVLSGFAAGYLSHQVLDSFSPEGLPLVVRGV
jgi:hypothetical protein